MDHVLRVGRENGVVAGIVWYRVLVSAGGVDCDQRGGRASSITCTLSPPLFCAILCHNGCIRGFTCAWCWPFDPTQPFPYMGPINTSPAGPTGAVNALSLCHHHSPQCGSSLISKWDFRLAIAGTCERLSASWSFCNVTAQTKPPATTSHLYIPHKLQVMRGATLQV